ncbi:unnamed protein product [Sphagnum troendelagicum]|uniref:TRF2/HOY1 PH-like domain-containing protein n=1 Tax=Sphagnum troendelagicum TaxID=128251 RepID=A0ABP0TIR6_9BRYO
MYDSSLPDSQPSLTRKKKKMSSRMLPPMMPPVSVVPSSVPFNPLEEPSPLGLTLRKTPSLLNLITLQLAQSTSSAPASDAPSSGSVAAHDKLKASNFPASTLKIGTWERISRYEGDLVAKCYYAKHKLVWEVLDNGLKSKMEIQWSDISAMNATFPESLPGSLEIEVSQPPLFFKETNPQPRKHTLWQATSDFTGGQATTCKRHSLQFPEGVLNKHYEKLVQCDPHLKALVEGTLVVGPSLPCDQTDTMFEGWSALHLSKTLSPLAHAFEGLSYQPQMLLSHYSSLQQRHKMTGLIPEPQADSSSVDVQMSNMSSPSSVVGIQGSEEGGNSDCEEYCIKEEFPTSTPICNVNPTYSLPMYYYNNEQKPSLNDFSGSSDVSASNRKILDKISQVLLGDSYATFSNEQAILLAARMQSMQAVLTKDFQTGPVSHPQTEGFVSDVHYNYLDTDSGQDSGLDYDQSDIGIESFIGLTKGAAF